MSQDAPASETPAGTQQRPAPEKPAPDTSTSSVPQTTVAPTGSRQAFRDIRRQIQEEDLGNRGVQKMLLDDLERADAECEILEGYRERYHAADKRAAVLEEHLRTQTSLEILFGVGVGLGGAILGVAPSLWNQKPMGLVALAIGAALVVGSTIGRLVKR